MPGAAFVAPNAPDPLPGSPGYQWFPISRIDPHEMKKGVERVGPVLDQFLDTELQRLSLPPERLILVGFSQGTMLGLHVGLFRARSNAGDCGFVGFASRGCRQDAAGWACQYCWRMAMPTRLCRFRPCLRRRPHTGRWRAMRVQWHLRPGDRPRRHPDTIAIAGQFRSGIPRIAGAFRARPLMPYRNHVVTKLSHPLLGTPFLAPCSRQYLAEAENRPCIPARKGVSPSQESARVPALMRSCQCLPGAGPHRRLPPAELLSAVAMVVAGRDQGRVPGAGDHSGGIRTGRAARPALR